MSDDPTLKFPFLCTRECPTCGSKAQPEDSECSLCKTILPKNIPLPLPQSTLAPPQAAGSTGLLPLSSPQVPSEDDTLEKAPPVPVPQLPPLSRPTPSEDDTLLEESPTVIVPSSPPLSPQVPTPSQPYSLPDTNLLPQPRLSKRQSSSFLTHWINVVKAALPLLALGILATYVVSIGTHKLSPPERSLPSPQPVGQVTTAETLFPIRVINAEPTDKVRGVAAFRSQVEKGLEKIREAYTVQLATNSSLSGVVILELRVMPEGQVSRVIPHATGLYQQELLHAIQNIAIGWRLDPTSGGEVKVFYPLLLLPEKIEPATFASYAKEVWPGRYKVVAINSVSVRARPSDSGPVIGTLDPGTALDVISSQDGWLGALSRKGAVGYLRREAISPRVENSSPVSPTN